MELEVNAASNSPVSPDQWKRAVYRSPPERFQVKPLHPTKYGGSFSYGFRIIPTHTQPPQPSTPNTHPRRTSGENPDSSSSSEYNIWRKWEDCLWFQDILEREYATMAREKRTRLAAGKGVKKNGVYGTLGSPAAASFESLPPGPDPNSIAKNVHDYLPRLSKKAAVFRASNALIEQRNRELVALVNKLLEGGDEPGEEGEENVPTLIKQLRRERVVRDFFGYWRRDRDLVERLEKEEKQRQKDNEKQKEKEREKEKKDAIRQALKKPRNSITSSVFSSYFSNGFSGSSSQLVSNATSTPNPGSPLLPPRSPFVQGSGDYPRPLSTNAVPSSPFSTVSSLPPISRPSLPAMATASLDRNVRKRNAHMSLSSNSSYGASSRDSDESLHAPATPAAVPSPIIATQEIPIMFGHDPERHHQHHQLEALPEVGEVDSKMSSPSGKMVFVLEEETRARPRQRGRAASESGVPDRNAKVFLSPPASPSRSPPPPIEKLEPVRSSAYSDADSEAYLRDLNLNVSLPEDQFVDFNPRRHNRHHSHTTSHSRSRSGTSSTSAGSGGSTLKKHRTRPSDASVRSAGTDCSADAVVPKADRFGQKPKPVPLLVPGETTTMPPQAMSPPPQRVQSPVVPQQQKRAQSPLVPVRAQSPPMQQQQQRARSPLSPVRAQGPVVQQQQPRAQSPLAPVRAQSPPAQLQQRAQSPLRAQSPPRAQSPLLQPHQRARSPLSGRQPQPPPHRRTLTGSGDLGRPTSIPEEELAEEDPEDGLINTLLSDKSAWPMPPSTGKPPRPPRSQARQMSAPGRIPQQLPPPTGPQPQPQPQPQSPRPQGVPTTTEMLRPPPKQSIPTSRPSTAQSTVSTIADTKSAPPMPPKKDVRPSPAPRVTSPVSRGPRSPPPPARPAPAVVIPPTPATPLSPSIVSPSSPTGTGPTVTVKASYNANIVVFRAPQAIPYKDLRDRLYDKFVRQEGAPLSSGFSVAYVLPADMLQSDEVCPSRARTSGTYEGVKEDELKRLRFVTNQVEWEMIVASAGKTKVNLRVMDSPIVDA